MNIEGDQVSYDTHIPYLRPEESKKIDIVIDDYSANDTRKYTGAVSFRDRVTSKTYNVPWCKVHSNLIPDADSVAHCFEQFQRPRR